MSSGLLQVFVELGNLHGTSNYARSFNKGRSSKFREGSRVRQTPEEGRRTYRPKRCGNNNKDDDNSPKTLNDKKKDIALCDIFWFAKLKIHFNMSQSARATEYTDCISAER